MRTLRHLGYILVALALVTAAGMAGFHYIEGWSWFDGFYMVLITFTTIGYQEVHPLSYAGRWLNVVLIVCGVSLLFLLIGTFTQALLEFELHSFFGRRRMEREIGRLNGHYIICGAGRVGRAVARELALREVPFVMVDNNEEKVRKWVTEPWLIAIGDATQEATLSAARIAQAAGLVAAATTDATNVYIVLTARGLNPTLKIIARASEESAEKHLLTAGANSVISPYTFTGHRIAQAFLRPHVLDFIDSATINLGLNLEIAEISVATGSRLAGQSLATSRIRSDLGVVVLAIKRGAGMQMNPSRDAVMEPGDTLIGMGEPAALRKLEQEAGTASAKSGRSGN